MKKTIASVKTIIIFKKNQDKVIRCFLRIVINSSPSFNSCLKYDNIIVYEIKKEKNYLQSHLDNSDSNDLFQYARLAFDADVLRLLNNLINYSVPLRFIGSHKIIAVSVFFNFFKRLFRVIG